MKEAFCPKCNSGNIRHEYHQSCITEERDKEGRRTRKEVYNTSFGLPHTHFFCKECNYDWFKKESVA